MGSARRSVDAPRLALAITGADLLHVRPILCLANCEPVEGGSIGWMAAGALVLVVGLLAIARGFRRGPRA
jgi:hypothetical protein